MRSKMLCVMSTVWSVSIQTAPHGRWKRVRPRNSSDAIHLFLFAFVFICRGQQQENLQGTTRRSFGCDESEHFLCHRAVRVLPAGEGFVRGRLTSCRLWCVFAWAMEFNVWFESVNICLWLQRAQNWDGSGRPSMPIWSRHRIQASTRMCTWLPAFWSRICVICPIPCWHSIYMTNSLRPHNVPRRKHAKWQYWTQSINFPRRTI